MVLDGEALQETVLDLDEEAEGDASTERGVCDDEVGQSASGGVRGGVFRGRGGDVVDVVVVVGVGELLGC